MEDLGTHRMKNFDITTVDNNKIYIMVARRRPGKSDLVNNILRIMKMNVSFKIDIFYNSSTYFITII
jgi:predicted ATP-binding protein involved in virulence